MGSSQLLSLERQFHFYKFYHSNTTNKRIHMLFVPVLLITAFALLAQIPLPPPVRDVSRLITGCYVVYCVVLNVALGLCFTPFILAAYAASRAMCDYVGPTAIVPVAFTLHFASWVAQFVGHFGFEGKSPALFDSLVQSVLAAPIVIWLEVMFALGFLPETRARLLRSRVVAKAKKAMEKGESSS